MAFETFKALGMYNGLSFSQIINQWINIYVSVKEFNRATTDSAKREALGGGTAGGGTPQQEWCKKYCGQPLKDHCNINTDPNG